MHFSAHKGNLVVAIIAGIVKNEVVPTLRKQSPGRGNLRNLKRVYLCSSGFGSGIVFGSKSLINKMRLFLFFVPAALLMVLFGTENTGVESYAIRITEQKLKENVSVLASDSLEGRETGKRGQRMAAAYIRSHFENIGLTGPANNGFFQTLNLYQSEQGETYVKVGGKIFGHAEQVIYYGKADSDGEVTLPLVYAGLGRDQDFNTINVDGKAVLIRIEDGRIYNLPEVAKARQYGARMVLVWNTDTESAFNSLAKQAREYVSRERPSLQKPSISAPNAGSFVVSPGLVETLTGIAPGKLKAISRQDPAGSPLSKLKPVTITYKTTMGIKTIETENVLGYLEGTDLKDEVIVISAHYDHIGISASGSGDRINNGADDDASGTAAVMQLASAFVDAKHDGLGPRRSILFMAFTGEEKGLLGSAYYADHPIFPMENTVINLNIDMIGRRDPQHEESKPYVYVIGTGEEASSLNKFSEYVNEKYCKLEFDYTYNDREHPSRLFYRSDHWNFAKNGVPVIFYFDGIHEDYHKPSDEVDKIEFDLLARRSQCIFYTAWEAANRDERIVLD